MLILIVIAFLIDTNVITGLASVPTKNGSSSITVLNACSQEPPCLVSYIIGFGDLKLYRSPILSSAETSNFSYANTTIGLSVTIFKHIDKQDPGTVIITKKLGDDEDPCFVVGGDYSTPKISKCLNAPLFTNGRENYLYIMNKSSPPFMVQVELRNGTTNYKSARVYAPEVKRFRFEGPRNGVSSNVNYSLYKIKPKTSTSAEVAEPIKTGMVIVTDVDLCGEITGTYENAVFEYVSCSVLPST